MSDYRSALRAARERIEQLEALGVDDAEVVPRKVVATRLVAVLAATLPVVVFATIVACAWRLAHRSRPHVIALPAPPAATAAPVARGLRWYPQRHSGQAMHGPWVATTAPDGKAVIVGLAYDLESENDTVRAVAFDRVTLQLRWSAGPYPGHAGREGEQLHRLVVLGARVVVSEPRALHVIDVSSGLETGARELPHGAVDLCLTHGTGPPGVILPLDHGWRAHNPHDHLGSSLFPWEHNKATLVLDPVTMRALPAPAYAVCEEAHYCAWEQKEGCHDLPHANDGKPTPWAEGKLPIAPWETWRADDLRVTWGIADNKRSAGAVGRLASTGAITWETLLTTAEHAADPRRGFWASLQGGRFFFLYETPRGPARLVALDAKDSKRLFDVELAGAAKGTRIHDLSASADDVFVSMNDELAIIDAATGKLRGKLGPF